MINSENLDAKVSSIMKENGAFFAFGKKQFDEKAESGVDYVSMGAGMIAPRENAATTRTLLDEACANHAKEALTEIGADRIIRYELSNYEAQITCDIADTVDAVAIYGITEAQVKAAFPAFMDHCRENDLF